MTAVVALSASIAILAIFPAPVRAEQSPSDLSDQSIEALMNVQVTSVSKTEQSLSNVAAAIFVITQEDIARSGATNIPDLLRMVPGIDVAQINSNTWAISSRGFNGRFSNDLLVLVDGRSVYTPAFGGVFWDALDFPLEDIERIEVIRGPGASIWGANAVNGVINIITKKSSDTKGVLAVAGGGNVDQGFGTLQYGGSLGRRTDYRVYTKYEDTDHLPALNGPNLGDGWHMLRGGFRSDTTLGSKDTLSLEGDVYTGREGNPSSVLGSISNPQLTTAESFTDLGGGFLQGIWNHNFSPNNGTVLNISYDRYQRGDVLNERRGTLNLGIQGHFDWGTRQNIVWGLTSWFSDSHSHGTLFAELVPANVNSYEFSSFVEDQITLAPSKVYLSIGAKLERNYYTGFDVMPSVRLAWTPTPHQTVWAAVARALRAPSAIDAGFRATLAGFNEPNGLPVIVTFFGNPNLKNEGLVAYEMGYRTTVSNRVSLDFAAYFNNYGDELTLEPEAPFIEDTPAPPHLIIPMIYENLMHGESHGAEISANWKIARRLTLSPGYAFEEIHMHLDPTSLDTTSVASVQGNSPDDSAQLRSHFTFGRGVAWDASAYFTDRLTNPTVPSYTRVDTGISWDIGEGIRLSLFGQNLATDRHEEFVDMTQSARTALIKRGAYAKFTWKF
jgi:iron complex outermembrane recepter protein